MLEEQQESNCYFKTKEYKSTLYEYDLCHAIEDYEVTLEMCRMFREASPSDLIKIRFNTPGGDIDQMLMIVDAMSECAAKIEGILVRCAGSAGSVLLLQCDEWIIKPFGYVMCHNGSTGYGGKCSDVDAARDFYKIEHRDMMETFYEGFLTKGEIESMIQGKDYYFNSDEVSQRLAKYHKYREKIKKQIQNKAAS